MCPLIPSVPEVFSGDVKWILLPAFHQLLYCYQSSAGLLNYEASHWLVTLKGKNKCSVKMYSENVLRYMLITFICAPYSSTRNVLTFIIFLCSPYQFSGLLVRIG